MGSAFLTFKQLHDIGLATEIGEYLKAHGIDYLIEDNNKLFDVTFANNSFDSNVSLKLKSSDFSNATELLNNFYEESITNVADDYYLFEFSDNELKEIVARPDEWGEFDFMLAQKILADRGLAIKPDLVELMHSKRKDDLSRPEEITSKELIRKGYIGALAGGIMAIVFGYNLAFSKKTMRDGTQFYVYQEADRKHGEKIVLLGIVSVIVWVFIILGIKLALKQ
jgi:hypothetical protein